MIKVDERRGDTLQYGGIEKTAKNTTGKAGFTRLEKGRLGEIQIQNNLH